MHKCESRLRYASTRHFPSSSTPAVAADCLYSAVALPAFHPQHLGRRRF